MITARTLEQIIADGKADPDFQTNRAGTRLGKDVAMWLLTYRVEHDMTRRQLSKKLSLDESIVKRLESGDIPPAEPHLMRLKERLT